jgi:hypothetical protein
MGREGGTMLIAFKNALKKSRKYSGMIRSYFGTFASLQLAHSYLF